MATSDTVEILLDTSSPEDYLKFLRLKRLPRVRFQGRLAMVPREYRYVLGLSESPDEFDYDAFFAAHVAWTARCRELYPLDDQTWNFIYGLFDPRVGKIRYIGKSERPWGRLRHHINDKAHCYRTHWIQSLVRDGVEPQLVLLECVQPHYEWEMSECRWIAFGRLAGWNLTNSTDGGDGVKNLPPETRERMRATWLGRKHTPESLVRIGNASRGRKHTEEYKQFMRGIMKDRQFSAETRRLISEKTRAFTAEQVQEIRAKMDAGATNRALGKEYGVHQMTMSRIRTRKKPYE